MLKHEIRGLYLQKRALLSTEQNGEYAKKITEGFLAQINQSWRTIHIFLPILEKNEVDTWPIIHQLWDREIEVAVPVMHTTEIKLESCLLTKETDLLKNNWQVQEPTECKAIDHKQIDVAIIPLLAFDRKGFRVGYGKGYYDSFLKEVSHDTLKIGLSCFPPLDKISDINSWDIPLDMCITPDEVFMF